MKSSVSLLRIDRLPALTTPVLVDSYGQMLLDAKLGGVHASSADQALTSEAGQLTLRLQLPQCPALRTGSRGDSQMNAVTRQQVDAQFHSTGVGLYSRGGNEGPVPGR